MKTYKMKKNLHAIVVLLTITLSYAQTKIKSSILQDYDGSVYINDYGYNYEYDLNGNLISQSAFVWVDPKWQQSYKITYTYNTNNQVIEKIEQLWRDSQYVNSEKTTYTYANNLVTQILGQDWTNGLWINSYRTTLTYNNNNQLLFFVIQDWTGTQWINKFKDDLTYTEDKLTGVSSEEWVNTKWVVSNTSSFTYTSNNNIMTQVINLSTGGKEMIDYVLDPNGNRIRRTRSFNGAERSKREYNYDTSALLSSIYHPFKDKIGIDYVYEDFPHIHKITDITFFFYNTSMGFTIAYRTIYDYDNQITLKVQDFESVNNINIYPNPSSDFILINGLHKTETVKVYNLSGKVIMKKNVDPGQRIDVQGLISGVYLVKTEQRPAIKLIKN